MNYRRWCFPLGRRLAPTLMQASWSTSTFTRTLSKLAKKEDAQLNVCAGTKTPLSCRVLVRPPSVDADSNEREIRASTAKTRPINSGARSQEAEAPVGWHTKRHGPRLARRRSLPRVAGDGGRSGKRLEALLNRPRAPKSRGAGSTRWRGQPR